MKRKTKQTINYLPILFWVLLFTGVLVFLLTTTLMAYHKNQKLREYARQIVDDIEEQQVNNEELRKEIYALKNDPFYLEMAIRRDLHMLKNGEIVITK